MSIKKAEEDLKGEIHKHVDYDNWKMINKCIEELKKEVKKYGKL